MLVLKRKLGEKVVISDREGTAEIVVSVLSVDGNGVRIGIDAPPSFLVLREELVARKEAA